MEIRSCRQAVVSGLKWLLGQQNSDGSMNPLEHGIASFFRLPHTFALMGQMERGARLAAWIRDNSLDEDGDFTGYTPRVGPLASFYHYGNAWLVMGLHRLGMYGLSLRGAEFLTTLQHPVTGGFLTRGPEATLDDMQDIMSTATAGLALLTTGHLNEAEAAGNFLVSTMDRQPNLTRGLLFVQQKGDRFVNDWPEDQGLAFALEAQKLGQWYFVPGLAGGFLAKLHDVTGQKEHLHAASQYIQFADSAANDRYQGPNAWWFGWGAAMLYAVSGAANCRKIVEQVLDNMVQNHMSSGSWAAGSLGYEPPAPIVDATAEAVTVITEILQALIIAE